MYKNEEAFFSHGVQVVHMKLKFGSSICFQISLFSCTNAFAQNQWSQSSYFSRAGVFSYYRPFICLFHMNTA